MKRTYGRNREIRLAATERASSQIKPNSKPFCVLDNNHPSNKPGIENSGPDPIG